MTLIFVYNAESGFFNTLTDAAHKILSPQTYRCSLCALTYDTWGMKKTWAAFVHRLPMDVRFLHRDDIDSSFPSADLPAIFIRHNDHVRVLADGSSIIKCKTIDELIALVENSLRE